MYYLSTYISTTCKYYCILDSRQSDHIYFTSIYELCDLLLSINTVSIDNVCAHDKTYNRAVFMGIFF